MLIVDAPQAGDRVLGVDFTDGGQSDQVLDKSGAVSRLDMAHLCGLILLHMRAFYVTSTCFIRCESMLLSCVYDDLSVWPECAV